MWQKIVVVLKVNMVLNIQRNHKVYLLRMVLVLIIIAIVLIY